MAGDGCIHAQANAKKKKKKTMYIFFKGGSKFWWRYKLDSVKCGHHSGEKPTGIAALRDCRFYIRGYSVPFALFRVKLQARELGFLKKPGKMCQWEMC